MLSVLAASPIQDENLAKPINVGSSACVEYGYYVTAARSKPDGPVSVKLGEVVENGKTKIEAESFHCESN